MMRVYAQILYSVLQANDDGIYIWAAPAEAGYIAISQFKNMFRTPDFKYDQTTQLHCTLLYHKGALPTNPAIPEDRPITGVCAQVNQWTDHKGREILVLKITSPEIEQIHEELISQGFQHGHPEFNAHITLGKFLVDDPTLVHRMNEYLDANPLVIEFQPNIYADSIT